MEMQKKAEKEGNLYRGCGSKREVRMECCLDVVDADIWDFAGATLHLARFFKRRFLTSFTPASSLSNPF